MNWRIKVLATTAAGIAVVFVVLMTMLALDPEAFAALDRMADDWAAPYRTGLPLLACLWVTTLGTGAALFGMSLTATGFLLVCRRTSLILPLWITSLGAQTSVWTLKYAINRTRPDFLEQVATAASPSFPSAHATGSAATLGFIAYAMIACGTGGRMAERYGTAFCALVLMAGIAASRVVLRVHFGTDVAGGILLGSAWLLIGVAISEHLMTPGAVTTGRHSVWLRNDR